MSIRSMTCLVVVMGSLAGCGSDDATATNTVTDSGTSGDAAPTTAIDHGVVKDYGTGKLLAGITLQAGTAKTTTDAKGEYTLTVPRNTPLQLVLTGPEYVRTILGEVSIDTRIERIIPIPDLSLFHVGQSALAGYEAGKGIVYILVRTTGSCANADGGTITVTAPADAKLEYFASKLPDPDLKAIKGSGDPDAPVAAAYNLAAGAVVQFKVDHPTCKQAPFPVTVDGVTYHGKVAVETGDANSVIHSYLQ